MYVPWKCTGWVWSPFLPLKMKLNEAKVFCVCFIQKELLVGIVNLLLLLLLLLLLSWRRYVLKTEWLECSLSFMSCGKKAVCLQCSMSQMQYVATAVWQRQSGWRQNDEGRMTYSLQEESCTKSCKPDIRKGTKDHTKFAFLPFLKRVLKKGKCGTSE